MADIARLTLSVETAQSVRDVQRLTTALGRVNAAGMSAQSGMAALGARLQAMGGSIRHAGFMLSVGLTTPLVLIGRAALKASSQMEQSRIAFGTFVGDMEKGSKLFRDLIEFSAKTPLTISGLEDSAQMLLATGTAAGDVLDVLRDLGNVARGDSHRLQRLALNFSQVQAQGKLTGRELRDFAIIGVPLIQSLAEAMGKTTAEIRKMVSAGQIGFDETRAAFKSMASEGGRFANLLEKMSQSLYGKWTTAADNVRIALASAIDTVTPYLKRLLDLVIETAQWFTRLPEGLKRAIVIAGAVVAVIGPALVFIGGAISLIGIALAGFATTLGVLVIKAAAAVAVFALLAEGARRFFGVSWAQLSDFAGKLFAFFANFRSNWGVLTTWLQVNWKIALENIFRIAFTVLQNLETNFKVLLNKIAAAVGYIFGTTFNGELKKALQTALFDLAKWASRVLNGIQGIGRMITDVMAKALVGAFTGKKDYTSGIYKAFGLGVAGAKVGKEFGLSFTKGLELVLKNAGTFKGLLDDMKLRDMPIPPFLLDFAKKLDLVTPKGPGEEGVEGETVSARRAEAFRFGTAEAARLMTSGEKVNEKQLKEAKENKAANKESAGYLREIQQKGVPIRGISMIGSFANA